MNLSNLSNDIFSILTLLLEHSDIVSLGSLSKNKLLYFNKKKYDSMSLNMKNSDNKEFIELIQRKQITKFFNVSKVEQITLINKLTKPKPALEPNYNCI